MTPLGFDPITAREMVGDVRARVIEAKARKDAEANDFSPPGSGSSTYFGGLQDEMARLVYLNAYGRRRQRIERMQ